MDDRESKLQFGCALSTCLGMVVMLACAGLVMSLGALNVPSLALPGASATAAPAAVGARPTIAAAKIDRIAVVGGEGNIYTMDRAGGDVIRVTNDVTPTTRGGVRRLYMFPTWAPDGRQIAFVGVASDGSARILSAGAHEANPRELFNSQGQVPIYLAWSPDGARVAFIAQDDQGEMSLAFANGDGSGGGELGTGSPVYFSWAPDARSVISHIGGSRRASADAYVGAHRFDGSEPTSLNIAPGNFLAPAFAPDGREVLTAVMGATERDSTLVASDLDGNQARTLAQFNGNIAFAWSPSGQQVAYLVRPNNRLGQNTQIRLVGRDGQNDRVIAEDGPVAFFWSPDGKKIAYLTFARGTEGRLLPVSAPAQSTTTPLEWKILDVASGESLALGRFTPTDEFAALVPFSDQYGQSLRIWSPDSNALLYAAKERDNSESIYVLDINGGGAKRISAGSMAAWSWQ